MPKVSIIVPVYNVVPSLFEENHNIDFAICTIAVTHLISSSEF